MSEFGHRPGSTSACLARVDSEWKGSMAMWVACIIDPSGKLTTLLDSPVIGKFSSGRTKLDVAPESKIMVDSARGVTLCFMQVRSHVFIVA